MLIRKKNSKKDLLLELELLKQENEQLKTKKDSQKGLKLSDISLFFQADRIDLLKFDNKKNTFSLVNSGNSQNILKQAPNSTSVFFNLFSAENVEQISNSFEKLEISKAFRIQDKLTQYKDDKTKESTPVELLIIRESESVFIIAIKDITDISKQKRELEKVREKVEESDRLKSTLLSNISHQIRTPLNSITGFSELIAGAHTDRSKRLEYIDIIKRQSKRILNLIDDISEIAKLESGSVNITKTPCNLTLLLKELLLNINQQVNPKRLDKVVVNLHIPENDNLEILTDSGRLQQALFNIISYSKSYSNKGTIDFGYTLNKENQRIEFYIQDNGDGLSKEEQKVVFDRFMVSNASETSKFEDSGLGLTIAKKTIQTLGGKIWVESEEGAGTKFLFTIPYEESNQPELAESIENEVSLDKNYSWTNKVILIVDDEDVNAMFLDAVFQITGVQLLFAKNGLQALELVKNIHKIDLILMDLKMPVMNGIKATAEIRKINQSIPIIAQTALSSQEDIEAALKAGCTASILKPIEVDEVLTLVNSYLTD